MHYLLKGIGLMAAYVVAATASLRAEPLASSPPHITFPVSQLQGESYIWQVVETPGRQFIAAGERIIFYEQGRWTAVATVRKAAIRCLLVDGQTLWIASPGQIGKFRLPLQADSRYEPVEI